MPFAPDINIELTTPAPKARTAIVSTVTLPSGDSAISSVGISFPNAFTFNERFRPPRCQPSEEAAEECPEGSKVGTVSADSPLGAATGEVFITDDFRLVAFAQALGGLIKIKADGKITARPDNGFGVEFTGLPDLPINTVSFQLESGDLALVKAPARCGTYTLPAKFAAHGGERATDDPTVTITGRNRKERKRCRRAPKP